MDCAEFRARLVGTGASASPSSELAAHAAACSKCAESLIVLAASVSASEREREESQPQSSRELLSAVERSVERERGPRAWLRSRSTPWRIALALDTAALLVGAVAVRAPRVDLAVYPWGRLAIIASVYAAALGLLVRAALRPMHRLAAPYGDRALLGLGLGLPLVLAILPPAVLSQPVSLAGQGNDCIAVGVALGVVFVVALRMLDREPRPARGSWLLLGAAALIANAALLFHCPIARPRHGLIVHAGMVPAALALMLALWFGLRRLLFARASQSTT